MSCVDFDFSFFLAWLLWTNGQNENFQMAKVIIIPHKVCVKKHKSHFDILNDVVVCMQDINEEKKTIFIYSILSALHIEMTCTDFWMEFSSRVFVLSLLHFTICVHYDALFFRKFINFSFHIIFKSHFGCISFAQMPFLEFLKSMFISFVYALYPPFFHILYKILCMSALSLFFPFITSYLIFETILFNGSLPLVFKPIFTVIRLLNQLSLSLPYAHSDTIYLHLIHLHLVRRLWPGLHH